MDKVKVRAFVAIELSDLVRQELSRIVDELKPAGDGVKWLDPSSMHITLKFLGDVPLGVIEDLKLVIENVSSSHSCFGIRMGEVGVFPGWRSPRVIWMGIDSGASELVEIAGRLESAFSGYGFPAEGKKFVPHITLGRVRKGRKFETLRNSAVSVHAGDIVSPADHITLFKSELTSAGAIHTPIARLRMEGG